MVKTSRVLSNIEFKMLTLAIDIWLHEDSLSMHSHKAIGDVTCLNIICIKFINNIDDYLDL